MKKQLNLIFGDYQHGFLTSQEEENPSAAFLCHQHWAWTWNSLQLSWCMRWDPSQLTLDVSKLGINHWLCCSGALHPHQRFRNRFDFVWLMEAGISDAIGSPRLWGLYQPQTWPVLYPSALCGCARPRRAAHIQILSLDGSEPHWAAEITLQGSLFCLAWEHKLSFPHKK